MQKTYTVTYDDGKNFPVSGDFLCPEQLPEAGEKYEFTRHVCTMANCMYGPGDQLKLMDKTIKAPHNRMSSLGNWIVQCKYMTSVWTNIEVSIAEGTLKLVTED